VWACPGTAQIFTVPLLSQECVKLQTSNLAGIFTGFIRAKVKNLGEKGAWMYPGTAQIFSSTLSHQRVKLRTSNLADIFTVYMRTKAA